MVPPTDLGDDVYAPLKFHHGMPMCINKIMWRAGRSKLGLKILQCGYIYPIWVEWPAPHGCTSGPDIHNFKLLSEEAPAVLNSASAGCAFGFTSDPRPLLRLRRMTERD